jgi:uncharacterized phiE125 gp8 family phage protein
MWYSATVAAPSPEPITAAQVKAQCRIDGTDEDTLIDTYIKAARAHIEAMCGVRFAARTGVVFKCDSFCDFEKFPEAPVTSITSISYVDTEGATQTLSTDVYELRADGLTVSIALKYNQTWPAIQPGSRITVTVAMGYATAPDDIIAAMLLTVAHWYANREAVISEPGTMPLPMGVDALVCNHRRYA